MNDKLVHRTHLPACAFTLIEVIVSLALATLLMTALLTVLRSVDRQRKRIERRISVQSSWRDQLRQTLQRDLGAAESIWKNDTGLELGMHPDPNHKNSRVRYRCIDTGVAGSFLVRSDAEEARLMAAGVTKLYAERIDRRGELQPLPTRPGPKPTRLRCWLSGVESPNDRPFEMWLR